MSFNSFDTTTGSSVEIDWCNEYLDKHPKKVGMVWDVTVIAVRDKGLIVETNDWRGFIFKSHAYHKQILQFIEAWSKVIQPSPRIQAQLTKSRPYFKLGTDEELAGYWVQEENNFLQFENAAEHNLCLASNARFPLPSPADSVELESSSEDAAKAHRKLNAPQQPLAKPTSP